MNSEWDCLPTGGACPPLRTSFRCSTKPARNRNHGTTTRSNPWRPVDSESLLYMSPTCVSFLSSNARDVCMCMSCSSVNVIGPLLPESEMSVSVLRRSVSRTACKRRTAELSRLSSVHTNPGSSKRTRLHTEDEPRDHIGRDCANDPLGQSFRSDQETLSDRLRLISSTPCLVPAPKVPVALATMHPFPRRPRHRGISTIESEAGLRRSSTGPEFPL